MTTHVLLIEDEPAIADTLIYVLKSEGMSPIWVNTGNAALNYLTETPIDFIILDVGLPDMNGFELFKRIREQYDMPIIFLTARAEEIDRVVGLEIGADDYVTKPFSPREVVARIKNILKRTVKSATSTSTVEIAQGNCHGFAFDQEMMKISYQNVWLDLTRSEFLLLSALMKYPKKIYSRRQLIECVWSSNHPSDDRVIDTHIKSLRQKIKAIDSDESPIVTHRGFGYSLVG